MLSAHSHICTFAQDLRPLGALRKLKHLSLLDNTVTKRQDYRLYVLSICPRLKVLDFKKVKDQVRCMMLIAPVMHESRSERRPGSGLGMGVRWMRRRLSLMRRCKWQRPRSVVYYDGCAMLQNTSQAKEAEVEEPAKTGPTPEQLTAIKAAIANASTLEVRGCCVYVARMIVRRRCSGWRRRSRGETCLHKWRCGCTGWCEQGG